MKQKQAIFTRNKGGTGSLRMLAESMTAGRRRTLRLDALTAHRLRRRLQHLAAARSNGDESLRRIKLESGHIEACLRAAQAEGGAGMPGSAHGVRVLELARALLDGGEIRLSRERLLEGIAAFDEVCSLSMCELQRMPAALYIALSEAFEQLAGQVWHSARQRSRAHAWMRRGGSTARAQDAFFACALQLAAEQENPGQHACLERVIERRGDQPERLVERVQHAEADRCLRLENLTAAWHMLGALDWEACFCALSQTEAELRSDPAGVYARMDDESMAEVRRELGRISRALRLDEAAVVRYALRLARGAAEESGEQAPRATVCYYLADDAGRAELCRMAGAKGCLPRLVPDPRGIGSALVVALAAAAAAVLIMLAAGRPLLMLTALPLGWVVSQQLISRLYPRWLKPRRILKLSMDAVPDSARTLVVLPVLLSSRARAEQMVRHMETLGCLERDANIDFLLLGDFCDAGSGEMPEDAAICDAARRGVHELNAAAGRQKYFYLQRRRSWRERDARWMGENRKRGALTALSNLLLDRPCAAEAFAAENTAAAHLAGRYRFAVTLDADTEYLPGTLQKLIGAMLHPLNRPGAPGGRGYAVLQPNMQLMAEARANRYVEIMAPEGGVDGYPVSVSDFYQDLTGRGCFAGKGIYDVQAFACATENRLKDDRILSHDLIEGILAGCGRLNDVSFYDTCPEDLHGELVRLHRWTRGDWQLLPELFSRISMSAADRMKLLGNLLRSLAAPALAALLIQSIWLDEPVAFCLGLALAFRDGLMQLPGLSGGAWRRGLLRLAVLPAEAACCLDAVLRTLWRLAFSGKHLMDWVPAADVSGGAARTRIPGRVAALLVLPGMLRTAWIPAVLALGAVFLCGAGWADELARESTARSRGLSDGQRTSLEDLARRTWRFFERYVPADGCGLPPDNVQFDPPVSAAMRTSPTNIGLYMMSCLSARRLDFITDGELVSRIAQTADTLEHLEKWNGQLYNWYDINDLSPLRPRYVSSVDSGNLAAALLLCAGELGGSDAALAARLQALAWNMNLAALYDAERGLFCIGMDAENGRRSASHYDLYASEARILSYAAMMLGQVPAAHWKRLSRAAVRAGRHSTLLSWSGTMFEYLMPELLLRSHAGTLAGRSRSGAVACQIQQGRALERPWGVSESGYYAFDMHLNYQYRAFGLRALALSPNAAQDVVTPYAAALALAEAPAEAAENLRVMSGMGLSGEFGMYEAADYMHRDARRKPRIVHSCMAHHQGMILCALCNALCADALARGFMQIPEARALRLLLQEKPGAKPPVRRRAEVLKPSAVQDRRRLDYSRTAHPDKYAAEGQLLRGGNTAALVTGRGAAFVWTDELQLNRFSGDLQNRHEGMFVRIEGRESRVIGSSGRAWFSPGSALYREDFEEIRAEMTVCISPEDGTLYQSVTLENTGGEAREICVTGCMAAALASAADMYAHPVFQNLFVESRCLPEGALVLRRRRREPGPALPELVYALAGAEDIEWESDFEKLAGRAGSMGEADGIAAEFSGSTGSTLNPCAALRGRVKLAAGERRQLHFALCLAEAGESRNAAARICEAEAPERALQLASTQALAVLGHTGVSAALYRLLQRAGVFMLDARLRSCVTDGCGEAEPAPRSLLWQAGISGDRPILLAEIDHEGQMDCVRAVIRMHAFYRNMGLEPDLAIINGQDSDYYRPVHTALGDVLASSHLNGRFGQPGGVHILDRQGSTEACRAAVRRAAALRFEGGQDTEARLRSLLEELQLRPGGVWQPMEPARADAPEGMEYGNGYGGFAENAYAILLCDGRLPPAPWCNVLASDACGAVVSERGGGFAWHGNSRSGRLTAFANDALREGWGWMFYLLDEAVGTWLRLLPGDVPMTDFCVKHAPGVSSWQGRSDRTAFEVRMQAQDKGVQFDICLKNEGERTRHLRLAGFVDWLMGTDVRDSALLRSWSRYGACFASGAAEGVGCFVSDEPRVRSGCDRQTLFSGGDMMHPRGLDYLDLPRGGWTLQLPLSLRPGESRRCRFLLGWAQDIPGAYALARDFRTGEALRRKRDDWQERLDRLKIETPDRAVNLLANGFLQAQVLDARIRARTGLYQPGGAYGFRDQLQDMLPMIYYEPRRVRRHLLYCAARQFEAGDVLHWWHEPYAGVRTNIRDDLLFLPYAAAQYVRITGDAAVLQEHAPFLKDIEIPRDREDIYAEMQPTAHGASLHEHCMRAFRRAAATGEHGLCLMGSGDWNDGMNRVGAQGRGESVWLSEFLAVCAAEYAEISPSGEDRAWLTALNERLCAALESHGWDGTWYLRAYTDEGGMLGGQACQSCRIDAISQAWAVFAGLDADRCASAMNAAWNQLADEHAGAIRLLHPPFGGDGYDPGYIGAYPPGVRENGAQYTHAACWLMAALARMGDAPRAHRALQMLLPVNHARSRAQADIYRVEPYVTAADVYTEGEHAGRGGWTWYTGSAAWLLMAILELLGFERRQDRVRMNALLGDWPEASVTLRFGLSSYRLVCRRDVQQITLDGEAVEGAFIRMTDDGREHTALFPPADETQKHRSRNDIFKCIYT